MDQRTFIVYRHVNKINNKIYVGITCRSPYKRWGSRGQFYEGCPHFNAAIQKYGWDNFRHEVLYTGLTRDQAANKQIQLISLWNTTDAQYGYNISKGGYSQPGQLNPFYGKHHQQRVKDIVAQSNKRRIWTQQARQKVSQKLSGKNSPSAIPVRCVQTGEVFDTMTIAAKHINHKRPNKISEVCLGHRHTAGGYHWQYAA